MNRTLDFLRTTLLGGVMFLIPLFVLALIFEKLSGLMLGISRPLFAWLGVGEKTGPMVNGFATLLAIILTAFLVGLFARTRPGQGTLAWLEGGILGMLPKVSGMQRIAQSLDSDASSAVKVVLVPTDAGYAPGVIMHECEGDWQAVFLPGSPEWVSGSVSYAHRDDIHATDISLAQLAYIMRARGERSEKLVRKLAELRSSGEI